MNSTRFRILRLNRDFARVYRRGKYQPGRYIVVHYWKKRNGPTRVGVSCSRKVKGAVQRNRRKRLLREAYRQLAPAVQAGYDVILIARNWDDGIKCGQVARDLEGVLRRIGILQVPDGPEDGSDA